MKVTRIKIKKAFYLLVGNLYVSILRIFNNIEIMRGVKVFGVPIINIDDNASIKIGGDVILNSFNDDYHVNMYGPIKLYVEGDGAFIRIGEKTRIHGSCIHARKGISIGKRCLIAANTNIIDSHGHRAFLSDVEKRYLSVDEPKEIVIEDDVWIGCNVIIFPGVKIGKGAIVSANSVVKSDIPSCSIVCGNPAVLISSDDSVSDGAF